MVHDTTRSRVLEAASGLGYRPNRAARGLITGRTGNLGVVVPDLGNPYFHSVLVGAQPRARTADYAVFVADSQEQAAEEASLLQAMARQVDGLVLCSSRLTARDLAKVPTDRLVLFGRQVPGVPSVVADNAGGMRPAVTHLHRLGHRRVAYLAGPRHSFSYRQRRKGLDSTCRELGVEHTVLGPVSPTFAGGVEVASHALASGATAVIAYNDLVTVGVAHHLAARGVAVPGEMSLVGFDDIAVGAMISPPLTTLAVPTEAAGRIAIELLLDRLERGRTARSCIELPTSLVVRQSTGAPPAHAEPDHRPNPRSS
jgi:DNA-binding LacI/PurR family transcriptional regulator